MELIASWSQLDFRFHKCHALRNLLRARIYDAASTDSAAHSNPHYSGAVKQSGTLTRGNLTLFIKCVTVNRRVLSEWQFNFRHLNYPLVFKEGGITCEGAGDTFRHNNASAPRVNVGAVQSCGVKCFSVALLHFPFPKWRHFREEFLICSQHASLVIHHPPKKCELKASQVILTTHFHSCPPSFSHPSIIPHLPL